MKDLSELFLPYELVLIAKEKGFNEKCIARYLIDGSKTLIIKEKNDKSPDYQAPLYQQITDWFIKKNIHIFPMYFHNTKKYLYMVYDENKFSQTSYTTMNEAIENAFKLI